FYDDHTRKYRDASATHALFVFADGEERLTRRQPMGSGDAESVVSVPFDRFLYREFRETVREELRRQRERALGAAARAHLDRILARLGGSDPEVVLPEGAR